MFRLLTAASLLAFVAGCSDYDLSKLGGAEGAGDGSRGDGEGALGDGSDGGGSAGGGGDLGQDEVLDVISQNDGVGVDVLFVVDDSCSMEEERDKLIANFDAFFEPFTESEIDWHVGVITTDILDMTRMGHLRQAEGYRYLDQDTENPERVFRKMVDAGIDGSLIEGSVLAVYEAIAQPRYEVAEWNAGFFRPDAPFHVIVVSDEDEQSEGELPYDEFIPWFQEQGDITSFSAVAGPSPSGCTSASTSAEAGPNYAYLTGQLDGVFLSICEADWAPAMADLGTLATERDEFFLSQEPAPGTLRVWVAGDGDRRDGIDVEFLAGGDLDATCESQDLVNCERYAYDPDRNSITFVGYTPAPRADVFAAYVPR